MAVRSEQTRIVYVAVPKAACTSIKSLFRDIAEPEGRRRVNVGRLLGRRVRQTSVHQVDGYRTVPFEEVGPVPDGYSRVTVVRDPLARLQSAWSNKVSAVMFARRGEADVIRAKGLPADPSFGEVIENYAAYRELSRPARDHTNPFAWHLGEDLGWYDEIFRLEDMARFEGFVSARLGRRVRVGRENRARRVERPLGFLPRHVDLVRGLLAEDYRLLDGIYSVDRGLAAFARRNGLGL